MIYLDNSATTSTDPDIAAIALDFMTNRYGNPSSLHHFGMDAYQAVMNARYQTARLIGAPTDSVYFTSGGTESNNIAIRGTALANQALGRHIVTTTIEHSSVLSCCQALEKEGFSVTYVAPSPETHRIEAQDILRAVREDTILISMMHVNNETGEVLPVREVAEAVHREHPHTLIHCDTVQSFGKIPVKLHELKVDLLSASGHKIHAPKGIGMLYIRPQVPVTPLEYGGAQEGHVNPGTESVPLICAFGAAAEKRLLNMKQNLEQVTRLNRYCRNAVTAAFPQVQILSPEDACPYVLNCSFPGTQSGDLVDALSMRDIYVSAGSACSRGTLSHVLKSAGYEASLVEGALRISFDAQNTTEEIDTLLQAFKDLILK